MLEVQKIVDGARVTLLLNGRVDAVTSAQLDEAIQSISPDTEELVLDMGKLEYVSSAGLRVLLRGAKKVHAQGGLYISQNVPELIHETLEMTRMLILFDNE